MPEKDKTRKSGTSDRAGEQAEIRKVYYLCRFTQLSPLRVGSNGGEETDSDVMKDNSGLPFIPGSSIAGVLRDCLSPSDAAALFGPLLKDKGDALRESRIMVSDATLPDEAEEEKQFRITPRDGVGINERGSAKDGAKYDFETVECQTPYTAVLELADDVPPSLREKLEAALLDWTAHGVSFGARTTRGYGKMRAEIFSREFVLTDPAQLSQWLTFDPMNPALYPKEQGFGSITPARDSVHTNAIRIQAELEMSRTQAELEMPNSFSVRRYTARPAAEKPVFTSAPQSPLPGASQRGIETEPDFEPLSMKPFPDKSGNSNGNQNSAGDANHNGNGNSGGEEYPVIPGTSWAGTVRHHMRGLIREAVSDPERRADLLKKLDMLFGVSRRGEEKRKSVIRFGETIVKDSRFYTVTRIAVDRFTAAPRNQGLFTARIAEGGRGTLSVELDAGFLRVEDWAALQDSMPVLLRFLAAALNDLHLGLMTVGGEGNIGRGICVIRQIRVNGGDVTEALHACRTDYLLSALPALTPVWAASPAASAPTPVQPVMDTLKGGV